MIILYKSLIGFVIALFAISTSLAQQTAKDGTEISATDPVLVFNRICFARVPNIQSITDLATQMAWNPITGDDLGKFTTIENPDVLLGWDVLLAKRIYRVGVVQSDLIPDMITQFPDFANGKATTCTLVLDGEDNPDELLTNMNLLAQREPLSTQMPEGNLLTTTWAGGTEDLKVFLFLKTGAIDPAGLLSVTILEKE